MLYSMHAAGTLQRIQIPRWSDQKNDVIGLLQMIDDQLVSRILLLTLFGFDVFASKFFYLARGQN